ncbi:MAG TPA: hypothetical protein ENK18_24710 [Deltaproteobacteria bacterium]|nr:hypothetical protein [Deltaproteobacteria bacterium]
MRRARRFVRAGARAAWNTALRALRGGEILVFFLPLLLFVPGAVLLPQLEPPQQKLAHQSPLVVALPPGEPGALRLAEALDAAGIERVYRDDPDDELEAGRVQGLVRSWEAPEAPGEPWRVTVRLDGSAVASSRLRGALQDARERALAEEIEAVGGEVGHDLHVLEVTRSDARGRPRMRILLGSLLMMSALASSLLLPRDLTQDREQGVLEAIFVTQSAAVADLAGRALGFSALLLWAPSMLLLEIGLFRGLLLRMGFQPVYVAQLATGVIALSVLALVPGVVARSAVAAVPWSIGVLWCSLGLSLGSIVLDAPGWPIVGMGTPAQPGLQLLTVAGNLGLAIGGIVWLGLWIGGPWSLGDGASR